ncbi:MAG: hypothetical protein LBV43_15655 [Prevotella sp.]|nr:hypothetical protein [Prevotella sp.]
MKKLVFAFILLFSIGSFYVPAKAQSINISINIGSQPAWGPVGYDYVGFYYFPDMDCYYDVNVGMFYYYNRGHWVSARYLPYAYRHYDLYRMHKVVLNVRDPWRYHSIHRRDYAKYRGYRSQVVIRDSRDVRYRDSRNNRVTWYSDKKTSDRQREQYNTGNGSANGRPKVSESNKSTGRNNGNYRAGSNSNNSNNKNSGRYSSKEDNNKREQTKSGNSYNNTRKVDKSQNSKVTRPAQEKKSNNVRLVSNTENNKRR